MTEITASELRIATANTDKPTHDVRTPTLISPPDSKTPPTVSAPRQHDAITVANANAARATSSEPVDPQALSRALERYESTSRHREHTPGASPSRKRQRIYGDRFIPNRSGQDLQASYSLLHDDGSPATPSRSRHRVSNGELNFQKGQ